MNFYESKELKNRSLPIKHNSNELSLLREALAFYHPELIIELGTLKGGLTLFFHETCPNALVISFDIELIHPEFKEILEDLEHTHPYIPIIVFQGDIFEPQVSKFIQSAIKNNKCHKFLYCDDGNKPLEVQTFSPHLQPRDLLGVHDWNTEIKEEDMLPVKHLFNPYMERVSQAHNLRFFIRNEEK